MPSGTNQPLRELRIELLQKCTLACAHCSADSSPSASRGLNRPLVMRLLHEGQPLGLESVVFTGGEPLIDENLPDYIAEASSLGIGSAIFTAGFLPNGNTLELITALADRGLGQVNVSLYSMDADVNAMITRKRLSLDHSKSALLAGVGAGLVTEVHFVPMAPNIGHLHSVAAWAADNGVSRLSVLRYVPQGRGLTSKDTLAPAPTDELRLRDTINEIRGSYPALTIHVGASFSFLGADAPVSCTSGITSMSVRSDGRVFPCDAFKGLPDAEFLDGEAVRLDLNNSPLKDIWETCPYMCATRQYVANSTPESGVRCAGGCPANNLYVVTP